MRYKGIIFDLDGTLVNTDIYVVLNYLNLFEKFCPERLVSLKELTYMSGPSLSETLDKYFSGLDRDALMKEYLSWAEVNSVKYALLYPQEKEVLSRLKAQGIKMGLVTNKIKTGVYKVLPHFGLMDYFDSLFYYEKTKEHKPHKEPLEKCVKELGLDVKDVLYVGDDTVDRLAASSLGIDFALANFGLKQGLDKLNPEYIIDSYEDLERIINDER